MNFEIFMSKIILNILKDNVFSFTIFLKNLYIFFNNVISDKDANILQ